MLEPEVINASVQRSWLPQPGPRHKLEPTTNHEPAEYMCRCSCRILFTMSLIVRVTHLTLSLLSCLFGGSVRKNYTQFGSTQTLQLSQPAHDSFWTFFPASSICYFCDMRQMVFLRYEFRQVEFVLKCIIYLRFFSSCGLALAKDEISISTSSAHLSIEKLLYFFDAAWWVRQSLWHIIVSVELRHQRTHAEIERSRSQNLGQLLKYSRRKRTVLRR